MTPFWNQYSKSFKQFLISFILKRNKNNKLQLLMSNNFKNYKPKLENIQKLKSNQNFIMNTQSKNWNHKPENSNNFNKSIVQSILLKQLLGQKVNPKTQIKFNNMTTLTFTNNTNEKKYNHHQKIKQKLSFHEVNDFAKKNDKHKNIEVKRASIPKELINHSFKLLNKLKNINQSKQKNTIRQKKNSVELNVLKYFGKSRNSFKSNSQSRNSLVSSKSQKKKHSESERSKPKEK